MENPPQEALPDHACPSNHLGHIYVAMHKPGHLIYWVKTCMLCGAVDWDALDHEIRSLIDARRPTEKTHRAPERRRPWRWSPSLRA